MTGRIYQLVGFPAISVDMKIINIYKTPESWHCLVHGCLEAPVEHRRSLQVRFLECLFLYPPLRLKTSPMTYATTSA